MRKLKYYLLGGVAFALWATFCITSHRHPGFVNRSYDDKQIQPTKVATDAEVGHSNLDIERTALQQKQGIIETQREIDLLLEKPIGFEASTAVLTNQGKEDLTKILGILKQHPDYKWNIVGHTDNSGNADRNITLSAKRADAVKKFFVINGINPDLLSSEGRGDAQPIADNLTADGRAINRRVEIKVMNE